MKTLWMEVDDLTGPPAGTHWFLVGDNGIQCLCRVCDATFPQTDAGWQALRLHEFEVHERAMSYDYADLDGQRLTIRVIARRDESQPRWHSDGRTQIELVAVADDGTVYCLPFSHYNADQAQGFKFRPQAKAGRLLGAG